MSWGTESTQCCYQGAVGSAPVTQRSVRVCLRGKFRGTAPGFDQGLLYQPFFGPDHPPAGCTPGQTQPPALAHPLSPDPLEGVWLSMLLLSRFAMLPTSETAATSLSLSSRVPSRCPGLRSPLEQAQQAIATCSPPMSPPPLWLPAVGRRRQGVLCWDLFILIYLKGGGKQGAERGFRNPELHLGLPLLVPGAQEPGCPLLPSQGTSL